VVGRTHSFVGLSPCAVVVCICPGLPIHSLIFPLLFLVGLPGHCCSWEVSVWFRSGTIFYTMKWWQLSVLRLTKLFLSWGVCLLCLLGSPRLTVLQKSTFQLFPLLHPTIALCHPSNSQSVFETSFYTQHHAILPHQHAIATRDHI